MINSRPSADSLIMSSHLKKVFNENVYIHPTNTRTLYSDEIMAIVASYPQTVLCGELVLQPLVGMTWSTTVDIFTTNTSIKSLPFGEWTRLCNEQTPGVIDVYSCKVLAHWISSVDGYCPQVRINIIHISSLQDLFLGFDFDFCKVWFDGNMIHVENYESVKTRSCKIIHTNKQDIDSHIEKYRKLGFTVLRDDCAKHIDSENRSEWSAGTEQNTIRMDISAEIIFDNVNNIQQSPDIDYSSLLYPDN